MIEKRGGSVLLIEVGSLTLMISGNNCFQYKAEIYLFKVTVLFFQWLREIWYFSNQNIFFHIKEEFVLIVSVHFKTSLICQWLLWYRSVFLFFPANVTLITAKVYHAYPWFLSQIFHLVRNYLWKFILIQKDNEVSNSVPRYQVQDCFKKSMKYTIKQQKHLLHQNYFYI